MKDLTSGLGEWVLLFVVMAMPLFLLVYLVHRKREAYRAKADEPFTRLPLRPAGESLRERIQTLSEAVDEELVILCCANSVAMAVALTSHRLFITALLFASVCILTIWRGRRVLKTIGELWDYRLGFKGERAVAEELTQLLAAGFRVFHDVPFDGFNIDHVIIGAPGVFVVETKTRRKPANIKGTDRATVEAHGDVLEFPHGRETAAVPQARLNAKTLGAWLSQATAERVVVNGIVTLPGWWVNRRQVHDVNVLNPEEIKHSFPTRPKNPLTPEQVQRIAHQMTERCRLAEGH